VIGWYVHHVGRGHLHHAMAVAAHLSEPVTVLSSLPRPDGWTGRWLRLPRDDDGQVVDPDAQGALHWAPLHHDGLRTRMATIAAWFATARPRLLVVDVSVEVVALARLHGVPVVTFCLPGQRTDAPHQLGFALAHAIIAPWPARFAALCTGLGAHLPKVCFTGAISRFDGRPGLPQQRPRRAVLLGGRGGSPLRVPQILGWSWTVLDATNWQPDPWPALSSAGVIVTHAGLGALADVAAARVPAVVVPQERPFGEQLATAEALRSDGVAVVSDSPGADWAGLLDEAVALGGDGWRRWADGEGAVRAAAVIEQGGAHGEFSCAS
jgi:hypothetical protein